MNSLRFFLLITISALILSCHPVRVALDYDRTSDFSSYSTFNYPSDMETGLSPLDEKRLLKITDSILQVKGFTKSEDPEILVDIYSQAFIPNNDGTVGVGVGGTGRNVGGGIQVGIPISGGNYNREIVFNLVDVKQDQLVFQAISESKYRENAAPVTRVKILQEIAAKVFEKYPPQ